MKTTLLSGAAALVLLAVPAVAQNGQSKNDQSKSVDPHQLAVQLKKPPLKLDDKQRAAIQNVLATEHTQQKAPKDFKPQVGAALPQGMKIDVMPQELGRQIPEMKEYGYAKTAGDILVLDPMNKKIVAVVPRKYPNDANAKSPTPVQWWDSHAQEMTGKAPQGGSDPDQSPDPGNAAAVGNGNAANSQPQDSGLQPSYQNKH